MFAFCGSIQREAGIDVGQMLLDVLDELHMQQKEAWLACGYRNPMDFSRGVRAEGPLDLWRLRHLPARVWFAFLPRFAKALTLSYIEEAIAEKAPMAKAMLRDARDERKAG